MNTISEDVTIKKVSTKSDIAKNPCELLRFCCELTEQQKMSVSRICMFHFQSLVRERDGYRLLRFHGKIFQQQQ